MDSKRPVQIDFGDKLTPQNKEDWIWVITHTEGDQTGLLVLSDPDGADYLPVFGSKEDGLVNQGRVKPPPGANLAIEAMSLAAVCELARDQGHVVVRVDAEGRVDKILSDRQ